MTTARTLKLTAGTTTTITTAIDVHGRFGVRMFIASTTTSPAYLSAGIGTINLSYLNLTWISAIGTSVWNAINSTDGGNNTGWNFLLNKVFQVVVIDTWKNVTDMKIRVGGVWKVVLGAKMMIGGVWKDVV